MLKRLTFVYWTRPDLQTKRFETAALKTGFMWAVLVTLFFGVVLGMWVTLSPRPQYYMPVVLNLCLLAGVTAGGLAGGFHARRQGFLHGGAVGILYGFLLVAISAVIAGGDINILLGSPLLLRLPLLILAGAAGGLVGVNIPVHRAKRAFTS